MSAPVVLIGGAAAVAAWAITREGADPIVQTAPIGLQPVSGASVSLQGHSPGGLAPVQGQVKPRTIALRTWTGTSTQGNTAASALADTAQRAAEKYVQENVDKLSAAARQAGAAKLNEALKLNPPLKGNESYRDIAKIAGGIAGAAGCSAVPGGATVAPLCAIAGAYLGVKGVDLAKRAANAIEDQARAAANAVGNAASKVWNSVF